MTDKKNDDVQIVELTPEYAEEVAKLHILGIHTGFISSLGLDFVAALYKAIATSESAFGFVVLKADQVVGYVAFTTNVKNLYKSVIYKCGLKLAFKLAWKMFSLDTIKKISETLFYPSRVKKLHLPSAELISIAIDPEMRSKSIATNLTYRGFEECLKRKIEKVRVLVGSENTPANKFYIKCCFEFITQIDNHGVLSNIYVVDSDVCKNILYEEIKSDLLRVTIKETVLPSVFVTYGWCRSSYAVVQSLGQRGIDVHVGDESPFAMARFSKYCKTFTRLPNFFIEPEKYFKSVCEALKKTGAKVLLPCHEDVGIFCRHKGRLPEKVYLAIPEMDSYNIAEDKFSIVEIAREIGCPTTETHQISSKKQLEEKAETINYPLIVKARAGNSAKGVRIAKNKKDLFTEFDELVDIFELHKDRWPIIQEFLPGEAVGVCLLYNKGKCIISFAERYVRCKEPNRFGTSTLREVFENKEVINHAIGIMNKLHWHGVAHLDFIADKDGVFKLIEINPRLWGALLLSIRSGVDFPYYWYLLAIGKLHNLESRSINAKTKCRWLIGDCMAFVGLIKRAKFIDAVKLMKLEKQCYHDDFSFGDPLPFVFEIMDYLTKFVKAGFSTNPVTENMIH